ncbi:lectin like domain-containing protein [Mycoplasma sp. 21DD0573]|uniref:lectin like domain-containing protein n=1 Tax=unclassified Mycoplasma TaxID=2683645 RepID=UPI002B1E3815|nr:lectin like domain-containing protein [Mycoplasma sp. 21DD0573]MEA4276200.1 lectin like domain-containing protein [Mycoplasma sp. 21DD0573]
MKLKNKKILTSLLVSPSLLIPFSVISTATSADSDAPKLELFQTKSAEEIARMPFFDARKHNLVTDVKNQGHEGLCWAYTIASILETNILKNNIVNYTKNSLDIDEHAIDYISNSWNHNADKLNLNPDAKEWKGILGTGNYLSHAFNGLMRNTSPIAQTNQTEFPNFDNPTIAKIKKAVKINHTVDDIKLAIAKYGSVGVAYAFNEMNFHPDTVWYNEPNSIIITKSPEERHIRNHASVIVGWDDDYYASNFGPETPKQRGGFIIKNSWGTKKMHAQGYFMLSYDSLDLIHEVMAVEVENNNAYQNTYYYDTKNSFSLFATVDTNERTMANIFPVKKANDEIVEKLKSINFALRGSNITAEIKIYVKNSSMSNPEDGELKLIKEVQIPNSGDKGFYTIDLNEEIILNKGQYFSIIVDVNNKGEKNVDLVASDETRDILSFYKYNNQWVNSKKSLVVFGIKAHTLEIPISELNKSTVVNEENKELDDSSENNTNNNPSESDTENNPPRSDDSESESESSEGEVETDTGANIEEASDSEISREEETSSPKTADESETDSSSEENNSISKESDASNVEDNSSPVAEDTTKNKNITDESSSEDETNSSSETGTDSASQDNNKPTTEDSATENKNAINENPTTNESSTIEKNNSNNKKELEDVSIESEKSKTNKTHVILWSILGVTTGIITFGIATFFIVKLMKKRVKK